MRKDYEPIHARNINRYDLNDHDIYICTQFLKNVINIIIYASALVKII